MRITLRLAVFCAALLLLVQPSAWCQQLYATGEGAQQLVQVDMATGAVTLLSTLTAKPDSLIVDSKGRILYTTGKPGTVSLFDPSTGATSVVVSGLSYPRDLVFDPGQTSFLVANFGIGAIDRVNLVTGAVTPLLTKQFTVDGLAYDPAGQLFAVVNKHTQIVQINPTTGAILNHIDLPTNHSIGWYGFDGLTYDSYTGELWVTDVGVGANCLVEIPTNLSTYTLFQVGNMLNPDGIISDGKGNLYIGVNLQKVYEYNIPTNTITKIVKVKAVDDVALVPSN
jgi:streptogramin lyase